MKLRVVKLSYACLMSCLQRPNYSLKALNKYPDLAVVARCVN